RHTRFSRDWSSDVCSSDLLAVVVQLMRNSLLETLGQDYIRTAKAKGLSQIKIIRKHALKNSLNPVITAVSGWFASMLAGAVFVRSEERRVGKECRCRWRRE